jgi:hypothetical protein
MGNKYILALWNKLYVKEFFLDLIDIFLYNTFFSYVLSKDSIFAPIQTINAADLLRLMLLSGDTDNFVKLLKILGS